MRSNIFSQCCRACQMEDPVNHLSNLSCMNAARTSCHAYNKFESYALLSLSNIAPCVQPCTRILFPSAYLIGTHTDSEFHQILHISVVWVINNFWLRIQFLTVWKSGTPIFNELPSGFCRRSNSRFLFFFFSYASHLVIAVFLCEPRSMCIKNIYRIILHLHPENNRFDDILIKCLAASSTRQLAIVCSIFHMSIKSSVLLQCTVKRMLHTAENNYAR